MKKLIENYRIIRQVKTIRPISAIFKSKNYSSSNICFKNQIHSFRFNRINKHFFSSKTYPSHNKLTLPSLSPSMETGTILSWNFKEGDAFKSGEALCSIETDKAAVDFEMNESGYLAKIIKPAGTKDIPLGELICITVNKKSDIEAFKDFTVDSSEKETKKNEEITKEKVSETKPSENKAQEPSQSSQSSRQFVSPLARNIANDNNVDLKSISGTGPNGRIIKADVVESLSKKPESPSTVTSSQSYEDIPVSQIRKVIASRLLESKTTIPHFYLNAECNVDKLLSLREKLNKVSPVKISINDIVIKACAIACNKIPEANSSWLGTSIRQNKNVDISVAVQTDNGLITPIIFNSDTKRLGQISKEVKDLAEKARQGKLKPQEFQGAK